MQGRTIRPSKLAELCQPCSIQGAPVKKTSKELLNSRHPASISFAAILWLQAHQFGGAFKLEEVATGHTWQMALQASGLAASSARRWAAAACMAGLPSSTISTRPSKNFSCGIKQAAAISTAQMRQWKVWAADRAKAKPAHLKEQLRHGWRFSQHSLQQQGCSSLPSTAYCRICRQLGIGLNHRDQAPQFLVLHSTPE